MTPGWSWACGIETRALRYGATRDEAIGAALSAWVEATQAREGRVSAVVYRGVRVTGCWVIRPDAGEPVWLQFEADADEIAWFDAPRGPRPHTQVAP